MTRAEERELILQAAKGDREAAASLIRAHQRPLYSYLLRITGDAELAEDGVQEAFIRALTNLDRFDTRYRFSTWLFTIARRRCVNMAQKHRPSCNTDLLGLRTDTAQPTPDTPTIAEEVRANARAALQAALLRLPERQRHIVVLFHQQGWSIAQVAEHLEMPEGTVKSHLHRARRRLRRFLDAHERYAQSVKEIRS